jgi:hypothetical protein
MKDQTHLMSQPKGDDTWMSKTGGFARDMTMRDHFAGQAMQKMVGSGEYQFIAKNAYAMADAMLKAREK